MFYKKLNFKKKSRNKRKSENFLYYSDDSNDEEKNIVETTDSNKNHFKTNLLSEKHQNMINNLIADTNMKLSNIDLSNEDQEHNISKNDNAKNIEVNNSNNTIEKVPKTLKREITISEIDEFKINPQPIFTDKKLPQFDAQITPYKLQSLTNELDLRKVQSLKLKIDTRTTSMTNLGTLVPNLKNFKLVNSYIPSISHLGSNFKNLSILSMARCHLSDITNISSLEQLSEVYLAFNFIKDMTSLSMLRNLSILDLESNSISEPDDLSFLSLCPNLLHLTIKGNPVCKFFIKKKINKIKTKNQNIHLINEDGENNEEDEEEENEDEKENKIKYNPNESDKISKQKKNFEFKKFYFSKIIELLGKKIITIDDYSIKKYFDFDYNFSNINNENKNKSNNTCHKNSEQNENIFHNNEIGVEEEDEDEEDFESKVLYNEEVVAFKQHFKEKTTTFNINNTHRPNSAKTRLENKHDCFLKSFGDEDDDDDVGYDNNDDYEEIYNSRSHKETEKLSKGPVVSGNIARLLKSRKFINNDNNLTSPESSTEKKNISNISFDKKIFNINDSLIETHKDINNLVKSIEDENNENNFKNQNENDKINEKKASQEENDSRQAMSRKETTKKEERTQLGNEKTEQEEVNNKNNNIIDVATKLKNLDQEIFQCKQMIKTAMNNMNDMDIQNGVKRFEEREEKEEDDEIDDEEEEDNDSEEEKKEEIKFENLPKRDFSLTEIEKIIEMEEEEQEKEERGIDNEKYRDYDAYDYYEDYEKQEIIEETQTENIYLNFDDNETEVNENSLNYETNNWKEDLDARKKILSRRIDQLADLTQEKLHQNSSKYRMKLAGENVLVEDENSKESINQHLERFADIENKEPLNCDNFNIEVSNSQSPFSSVISENNLVPSPDKTQKKNFTFFSPATKPCLENIISKLVSSNSDLDNLDSCENIIKEILEKQEPQGHEKPIIKKEIFSRTQKKASKQQMVAKNVSYSAKLVDLRQSTTSHSTEEGMETYTKSSQKPMKIPPLNNPFSPKKKSQSSRARSVVFRDPLVTESNKTEPSLNSGKNLISKFNAKPSNGRDRSVNLNFGVRGSMIKTNFKNGRSCSGENKINNEKDGNSSLKNNRPKNPFANIYHRPKILKKKAFNKLEPIDLLPSTKLVKNSTFVSHNKLN